MNVIVMNSIAMRDNRYESKLRALTEQKDGVAIGDGRWELPDGDGDGDGSCQMGDGDGSEEL